MLPRTLQQNGEDQERPVCINEQPRALTNNHNKADSLPVLDTRRARMRLTMRLTMRTPLLLELIMKGMSNGLQCLRTAPDYEYSEAHPIYDQMKSSSSAQPTTTGTTTSAGQTGTSTGLGHTEHMGTGGSLGDHSVRPGAPGAGNMHEGISEASIKSGVIGFGTGERQEHAALSSRQNPEAGLDRNQVVGGGNMAPGPTTADTSEQPSTLPRT
jgi:hypothetical protein